MSTAGKVLVVLVMLSMVFWLIMASAVTQLNSNAGELVAKNDELIDGLQKDLTKAQADLYSLRKNLALEQEKNSLAITYVRGQISNTERRQADIVEALERIKVQVILAEKASIQAIANKEQRTNDVADLQVEKARLLDTVDTLKAEDSALREQSESLLTNLKNTLVENKKLADRAATKSNTGVLQ